MGATEPEGAEIEVTPEMIEAAVPRLLKFNLEGDIEEEAVHAERAEEQEEEDFLNGKPESRSSDQHSHQH